ncbi:hypothetical protein LINPERPRIM_LOCUS26302 [Linum perenne]
MRRSIVLQMTCAFWFARLRRRWRVFWPSRDGVLATSRSRWVSGSREQEDRTLLWTKESLWC